MEQEILNLLKTSEEHISGEYLSQKLSVSRTAIWKHIKNLKSKGYEIEGVSNKGYKLLSSPNKLNETEISHSLNTSKIGKKIFLFETIDSTNKKAKDLARKDLKLDGAIVISEEQKSGNGRFRRIWNSPRGGLWFSLILRPKLPPSEVPKITQVAGAAMYKTLKKLSISCNIKWPNDILIKSKKACGILAEMKCDMDCVHYLILGIGLNVNLDNADFDDSLKDIVTSLKMECDKEFNLNELLSSFLNTFENMYFAFINDFDITETVQICKDKSDIWGKKAKLINFDKEEIVTCISLSDTGNLIVLDKNSNKRIISSGEISFKGL